MLSKEIYNRVLNYYDEYKKEYNKKNLIGIIPYECDDDTILAYTSNEELMDCIKNGLDITLYVSPKFMLCSEQYVKAVLFHEFTHISDAYNFVEYDNSNFLMSTFSEYNATRIEIMERCKNKSIILDEIICGENGSITLKEEIEDKIDTIIMILKISKENRKNENEGYLFENLIKNYSYVFAYLSFFEDTEREYFQNCFARIEKYEQLGIGKRIYNNVKSLDIILNNPEIIILDVVKLYQMCFD